MNLVGLGRGVSPASQDAERYHARPDVAWVPFRDDPTVDYCFLWPTTSENARVRAFVDTVRELWADRDADLQDANVRLCGGATAHYGRRNDNKIFVPDPGRGAHASGP
ncbi:hypothetical protein [Streptomyces sp. E-08]|uniref:hypothetical protein n=1 Tax=Streptomyces sp. E-08 TaxID=3404047 RepID=UPI003CF3F461